MKEFNLKYLIKKINGKKSGKGEKYEKIKRKKCFWKVYSGCALETVYEMSLKALWWDWKTLIFKYCFFYKNCFLFTIFFIFEKRI